MSKFSLSGTQNFMGKVIPVVYGGFGENQKCISDKTIAEIHEMENKHIRERITGNIKRFKPYIDIIDLKQRVGEADTLKLLLNMGYAKQSITQAEHIYILSERGYAKLIKIMDTDLAWEIHDKLVDEYFSMREILDSEEQKKAKLLLHIYDGGQNAVIAAKELNVFEVQKATAPLIPKAEFHDAVSVSENCINFGKFAACFQNNINSSFGRNQIMEWCREQKYLCSSRDLKNKPSQKMITLGYMKYKEEVLNEQGKNYIKYTPMLTGKGQIWLTKKLKRYFKNKL